MESADKQLEIEHVVADTKKNEVEMTKLESSIQRTLDSGFPYAFRPDELVRGKNGEVAYTEDGKIFTYESPINHSFALAELKDFGLGSPERFPSLAGKEFNNRPVLKFINKVETQAFYDEIAKMHPELKESIKALEKSKDRLDYFLSALQEKKERGVGNLRSPDIRMVKNPDLDKVVLEQFDLAVNEIAQEFIKTHTEMSKYLPGHRVIPEGLPGTLISAIISLENTEINKKQTKAKQLFDAQQVAEAAYGAAGQ